MNYIVLFLGLISILFSGGCNKKSETRKTDSLAYHQPLLESRYEGRDHQNEKKVLKEKIKRVNQSAYKELNDVSEWFTNVAEAIDMME